MDDKTNFGGYEGAGDRFSPRSRTYCMTINNYDLDDIENLKKLNYKYLIIGDEVGKIGATPHLQVFVHLKYQSNFSTIKKKFPRAHIEVANGNDMQNKEYCSKQNVLFEDGQISKQGERTDIEKVKEIVSKGGNMRNIVAIAKSVQSVRMAEIHLKYFEEQRNWKPHVSWYWGASGTGKSKRAHEEMPDAYVAMETATWWEGYDAHEDVIIDDMRKNFCTFSRLLVLLDRYPCRIECKGGSRQFVPRRIIITSCYSPHEMYDTREDYFQLIRRIDKIEEF
jgi:hypothetical protein